MMKILVTGDTGFFGKHLVSFLLSKNVKVLGLSRHHSSEPYETLDFDITSGIPDFKKIDSIIHLASDVTGSKNSSEINLRGTKNMLELGKKCGIRSFVYASSGAVYGFQDTAVKETTLVNPENDYAKTKLEGEKACEQFSKYFNVTILRYFFPYGPSERTDRLIPKLIKKINDGSEIELNKEGKPVINPIFIDDAVKVTFNAVGLSGTNTLNVGGSEKLSIGQIVSIIEECTGKKAKIVSTTNESRNMMCDISKAQELLGLSSNVGIKEGIKRTVDFQLK